MRFREQFTYAIQCEETGRIKIGKSAHPNRRFVEIRTMSATRLAFLGLLRCQEYEAHESLADYRLHGEWFAPEPAVIAFVARHAAGRRISVMEWRDEQETAVWPARILPRSRPLRDGAA